MHYPKYFDSYVRLFHLNFLDAVAKFRKVSLTFVKSVPSKYRKTQKAKEIVTVESKHVRIGPGHDIIDDR